MTNFSPWTAKKDEPTGDWYVDQPDGQEIARLVTSPEPFESGDREKAAHLLALAPTMRGYISTRATLGDKDAIEILALLG